MQLTPGEFAILGKKTVYMEAIKPLIQQQSDYWLISDDLQDDVDKRGITPSIKSDHSAIFLNINTLEVQATGPSYWKLIFNSSLLEEDHYIHIIHSEYPNWINEFSDVTDKCVL